MTGADQSPEPGRNGGNPEPAGRKEIPQQPGDQNGSAAPTEGLRLRAGLAAELGRMGLGLRADRWASGNPVLPAGFSGRPATPLRLPGLPERDGEMSQEKLAEAGEPLTAEEIVNLLDLRKLPRDHPSSPERPCRRYTEPKRRRTKKEKLTFVDGGRCDEPLLTTLAIANVVRAVLTRSGVAAIIERELRSHRGQKSDISVELVLLAIILAAWKRGSYRRTDVCAVIAGLDPRIAFEYGVCTRDAWTPPRYKALCARIQRIEELLGQGFYDKQAGVFCDLQWLADRLTWASVPAEAANAIKACVIDSTAYGTWAISHDYTPEKEAAKSRRMPEDELRAHRAAILEDPDLPEPELERRDPPPHPKIGLHGSDGRLIRSWDFDARPGWRTATNKDVAEKFLGYDVTLSVATYAVNWRGNVEQAKTAQSRTPAYILSVSVAPAGQNPGPAGYRAVERSLRIARSIGEVLADRAYTVKRIDFNRRIHALGLSLVMDHTKTAVGRYDTVKIDIGGHIEKLILHCGHPYPAWMRRELRTPPAKLNGVKLQGADLTKWYNRRAKKYRYSFNQDITDVNGHITGRQFKCPVCADRVAIRGRASDPNTGIPQVSGPRDGQNCCQGLPDIPLEYLDFYQPIPFGTGAWKNSYNRRNQVENAISMIGEKGSLDAGSCRAFGLAAHTIAATSLATAHNIWLAERAEFVRRMYPEADRKMGTEDSLTAGEPLLDPEHLSNTDHVGETPPGLLDPKDLITTRIGEEEEEEDDEEDQPAADNPPPDNPETKPSTGRTDANRPPQTRQNSPP